MYVNICHNANIFIFSNVFCMSCLNQGGIHLCVLRVMCFKVYYYTSTGVTQFKASTSSNSDSKMASGTRALLTLLLPGHWSSGLSLSGPIKKAKFEVFRLLLGFLEHFVACLVLFPWRNESVFNFLTCTCFLLGRCLSVPWSAYVLYKFRGLCNMCFNVASNIKWFHMKFWIV